MAANRSNIPKHELEIIARHFLPQIQAFFESEEGRKEYEEWKEEQANLAAKKSLNKKQGEDLATPDKEVFM